MTTSQSKLNPVYAAIDAFQFSRAIKLASALPDSNILGKALLAHSYTKAGQKHQALITIHKILIGEDGKTPSPLSTVFFELQNSFERYNAALSSSTSPTQPSKPESTSSTKKQKKGKKKSVSKQPQQLRAGIEEIQQPQMDLIDRLDMSPPVPEKVDFLCEKDALKTSILTDETTLATLAVSLKGLSLPLTAYQMYARAASASQTEHLLTKTFAFGLSTLAAPYSWDEESRERIESQILSHMQTISLQLARVAVVANDNSTLLLATSWACQSATWQLEWLPEDDKRNLILSRLSESMAKKLLLQEEDKNQRSKEIYLLCLRILKRQSKLDEMLQLLEGWNETSENTSTSNMAGSTESMEVPVSEFGVAMTSHQLKLELADVLKKLNRYDDARLVYEDLLQHSPDNWSCWKAHLECSTLGGDAHGIELTLKLAKEVNENRKESGFPLRGPHLMLVEIATEVCRTDSTDENMISLGSAIQEYAETFAHRANCTIVDLEHYLNFVLSQGTTSGRNVTVSLLEWAISLRKNNSAIQFISNDVYCQKEHRSKLRAYIFALKLLHKLLSKNRDLVEKYLPDWIEIVREWQATLSLSEKTKGDKEILKELEPGDALVLLAVQQLLFTSEWQNHGSDEKLFAAAVLLESAIENSPGNAYLKFIAIEVFHRLDATTRSWDFFQSVGLKHIQLDSCSFVIFPYLFEGGLYNEAIAVSKALLRFHGSAARDCGDYSGKAMNAGNLSKADEFMVFQRQKMSRSLTSLYSKGFILDAAPLLATEVPRKKHDEDPILKGAVGITQGIVGGTEDIERATQMVVESHNPYAALSVVTSLDRCEDRDKLSDNRDVSILNQVGTLWSPRFETKQFMVSQTLRRGHVHGLLIRASLCVDAMKSPKKGKVVKPSVILEKRTQSLLNSVLSASEFFDRELADSKSEGSCETEYIGLLRVFLSLCRALSIVNAGMPKSETGNDTIEQREVNSIDMIRNQALKTLRDTRESMPAKIKLKSVCAILPSHILPIFTLLRMCSTVFTAYGWGKRKTTKKVSAAMAELCKEFQGLLEDDLMPSLRCLPLNETDVSTECPLNEEAGSIFGVKLVKKTKDLLNQSRYRTRMRIQPILEEMIEFLKDFEVPQN